MKEKHGEYISIYWDDDSDLEYVRGHVTLEEARAAWDAGGTPEEILARLPYLKMVWDETLRLYPPALRIDREAMAAMGKQLIGNPSHFVWVAVVDGRVTACVAAMVQPGFWFRKLQASVILFYAREPGAGALLLRRFSRWVKSRSGIKLAVFECEPNVDPRILALLERLGFARRSTNLSYVRNPQ